MLRAQLSGSSPSTALGWNPSLLDPLICPWQAERRQCAGCGRYCKPPLPCRRLARCAPKCLRFAAVPSQFRANSEPCANPENLTMIQIQSHRHRPRRRLHARGYARAGAGRSRAAHRRHRRRPSPTKWCRSSCPSRWAMPATRPSANSSPASRRRRIAPRSARARRGELLLDPRRQGHRRQEASPASTISPRRSASTAASSRLGHPGQHRDRPDGRALSRPQGRGLRPRRADLRRKGRRRNRECDQHRRCPIGAIRPTTA